MLGGYSKSADNNFKFDENSRKFSKQVENTVGEGEIARYEQFLLFPQCFQQACFPWASKGVCGNGLLFTALSMLVANDSLKKTIVRKLQFLVFASFPTNV